MSSPRRRQRLLAAAVATAVALAVAEVAVRLVLPQWALAGMDFFVADPELGWVPSPNAERVLTNQVEFRVRVRTDALGLRAGTPRGGPALLGVGDSFMFGFGVEADETFLARAAETLGTRAANAGGLSYGPCQATGRGERLLDAVEPEAVVLSLFLGNDELDASRGSHFLEVRDGALGAPGWRPSPLRPLLHPLLERSHLVRLVRYSPPVTWAAQRLSGREDRYREALRESLAAHLAAPPPEIAAGDAAIAPCLGSLREAAAARSIPLLVVLVPDWTELDPARLAADAALLGESRLDAGGPRRRLSAIVAEAGLPLLDLTPALAESLSRGERIYFPIDRHLTPLGHRRAAEPLAAALRELLAKRATPSAAAL